MKKEFFNDEELEALKGGQNEAPVKSENEINSEEDGEGLICCSGNSQKIEK